MDDVDRASMGMNEAKTKFYLDRLLLELANIIARSEMSTDEIYAYLNLNSINKASKSVDEKVAEIQELLKPVHSE